MSEVLRISGANAGCDPARRRVSVWLAILAGAVGLTQGAALVASATGQYVPGWVNAFTLALLGGGIFLVWRMPWAPALVKDAPPIEAAAIAPPEPRHAQIEAQLRLLPHEFQVTRMFRTADDSFEYLITGPGGIFVVETKSWRGLVTADGTGELLHNEAEMPEPHIRTLMARVMEFSRALREAQPALGVYAQPVMVFTAAEVRAPFGTTRTVHCIRDEQLADYLVHCKRGCPLEAEELRVLEAALLVVRSTEAAKPRPERPTAGG